MEFRDRPENQAVFQTAYLIDWLHKPLEQFTNDPSVENISIIQDKLKRLSLNDIQNLQNILILPADFHLRKGTPSDSTKCMLFDYLEIILDKSSITNVKKFHQLLTLAFFQVYEFQNPTQPSKVSEELILSVLSFTIKLMKKITFDKKELYTNENIAKIGQALFISTKIIKKEKFFNIKLKGIKCIAKLTQCDCNSNDLPLEFRLVLSKSLRMLFPGLSTSLFSIIKQADLQQHELTKEALITWSRLVVLILKDQRPSKLENQYQFELHKKEVIVNDKANLPNYSEPGSSTAETIQKLFKEQEWIMSTSHHLRVMINDLTPLSFHSHPDVREVLATAASLLILHCVKNLGSSLLPLLESLLVLQEDEYTSVASTAIEGLDRIRNHLNSAKDVSSLINILEEGFLKLITSLPGLVFAIDDAEQKRPLLLLRGYATVLGPTHLLNLLTPTRNCQRLLASLVAVFTLDITQVSLIASSRIIDLWTSHDYRFRQWLQFAHLRPNDIDRLIDSVLDRILSNSEIIDYILDEIIDYYHREPLLRAEISIIINAICRSKNTKRCHLITILELYLDPAHWQQLSASEEFSGETQRRVLEGCLQVEGLGAIGISLGKEKTPLHEIIRILIAILERAGSSISLFSLAGRQALEKFAFHVYNFTIPELLSTFSQHLASVLGTRIRREKDHVRITATLEILAITLQFAGNNDMGHYRQAVKDIIDISSSTNASEPANGYLRVLKSLIERIDEWLNLNKSKNSTKNKQNNTKNTNQNIIDQLNEYYKNKVKSTHFDDKNSDEETPKDVHQNKQNQNEEKKTSIDDQNQEDRDVEKDITTAELSTHVLTVDIVKNEEPKTPNNVQQEEQEEQDQNVEEDQDEEEEEIKISDQLTDLLEAITRRCMHYLPSKTKINRLLALEVIDIALPLLFKYSKDDTFLPLVHKIWPSLVAVFHHNSDLVLTRVGWSVLLTIVTTSKTFVTTRLMKEIWPGVLKFLNNSETNFDETTQVYKLRIIILRDIPIIVNNIYFNEKEFYCLLKTCSPYLETRHPRSIQEICRTLYMSLSKINQDSVWLFLINNYKSMEMIPPSTCPDLCKFNIRVTNKMLLYGTNIEMILKAIS